MRDYNLTFILEHLPENSRLECDLLHGTVSLDDGKETYRIPHRYADALYDRLDDLRRDPLYDASSVLPEQGWLLESSGSIEMRKAGWDIPETVDSIISILTEGALLSGKEGSVDLMMRIQDYCILALSIGYRDFARGRHYRRLSASEAKDLISEARQDLDTERGRLVAEMVFIDLLLQSGYDDIVNIWTGWEGRMKDGIFRTPYKLLLRTTELFRNRLMPSVDAIA